jgi:hypothetical protein
MALRDTLLQAQTEADALLTQLTAALSAGVSKDARISDLAAQLAAAQAEITRLSVPPVVPPVVPPTPTGPSLLSKLGVSVPEGANTNAVKRFESWLGKPVSHVLYFTEAGGLPYGDSFPGKGYHVSPKWSQNLTFNYTEVVNYCKALVANGHADANIRMLWEFNGSFMSYYSKGREAQFVKVWQQNVSAARSVPGQKFTFTWCPIWGGPTDTVEAAYPGDTYVDYIGLDCYGQFWGDRTQRTKVWTNDGVSLAWHRKFAAAHGKKRTFDEWGLTTRTDGGGTNDDVEYMQLMLDEFKRDDVAWAIYFDYDATDGRHRLEDNQFPDGGSLFKRTFSTG